MNAYKCQYVYIYSLSFSFTAKVILNAKMVEQCSHCEKGTILKVFVGSSKNACDIFSFSKEFLFLV